MLSQAGCAAPTDRRALLYFGSHKLRRNRFRTAGRWDQQDGLATAIHLYALRLWPRT
jgi:hypothetical protein